MSAVQTVLWGARRTMRGAARAEHADSRPAGERVGVSGKFFRMGDATWYLKGLAYGPFAPNADGAFLPERPRVLGDLDDMAALGATALRLYHPPTPQFLDDALDAGLRVLIDVPWEKHRCFLEDRSSQQDAIERVRHTASELSRHPAVLGISVANEIPKDVVRFYGTRRVERFLGNLLDSVKQQSPECLATYTNYPSTEFLNPGPLDFISFNVYLEGPDALAAYLDRLQHIANGRPLVLGEFGLDSYHHGEAGQAAGLRAALSRVYRRGLAGAFVFSYTDDWFAGGHQMRSWAFGITDQRRTHKPAASALREIWSRVPRVDDDPLPSVSVVVCSYNGAATLEECLRSLVAMDYPDYEVILVDDGSTDRTPEIASKFPSVRYIRQCNHGLSIARNVGAQAARGQIVAYTDSDCVADEKWLLYLATAMADQQVQAIGGPNLPPASDNWVARCVAASPGGPSHVMLDDRLAEHVPGCNMAFEREALLKFGAFDPQFRVAGDDVDVCWRLLDANVRIGYAPAALVWHHRRATAPAYFRQQKGYGRAEGMLQFKHPCRFNTAGGARWSGIIYGEGAVGLPLRRPPTYYGKFGMGLFQMVYRHNQYSPWAYFVLLEWHLSAALLLVLSAMWHPVAGVAGALWLLTLVAVTRSSLCVPLPPGRPWWCRPLVFALHLLQPMVRSAHRYAWRLGRKRVGRRPRLSRPAAEHVKRVSLFQRDSYWQSLRGGRGREQLLEKLTEMAGQSEWPGFFGEEWADWDIMFCADWWHNVSVQTATEELGGPKRFTRVRCTIRPTAVAKTAACAVAACSSAALLGQRTWAIAVAAALWLPLAGIVLRSGRRCFDAVLELIWQAGLAAELDPVSVRSCRPAQKLPATDHALEKAQPARVATGSIRSMEVANDPCPI